MPPPPWTISEPVFGGKLYIAETEDAEEVEQIRKLIDLPPLDTDDPFSDCWAFVACSEGIRAAMLILAPHRRQDSEYVGDAHIIPHEVTHYVHHLAREVGIEASPASEEWFAYMSGYFCERLFARL